MIVFAVLSYDISLERGDADGSHFCLVFLKAHPRTLTAYGTVVLSLDNASHEYSIHTI